MHLAVEVRPVTGQQLGHVINPVDQLGSQDLIRRLEQDWREAQLPPCLFERLEDLRPFYLPEDFDRQVRGSASAHRHILQSERNENIVR
jgi:hypothetical protein